MQQEDKIYFDLLKKEIAVTMRKSHPEMNPELSEWKGHEIMDFQEDLLIRKNGRLSEKWFYTHIKSTNSSLPRIDVLNILSQYSGYRNWDDFRFKNSDKVLMFNKLRKTNNIFIKVPILVFATVGLLFILFKIINTQNYTFTFIDKDTGNPILNSSIQAELFLPGQSPVFYKSDDEGIIGIRTNQSKITMVVRASYYLTDTIVRTLKKFNRREQIGLNVDSYALMIRYFSQTDVTAWQKRREQLDQIFNDNALIYQAPMDNEGTVMELFNKWDFINKLTMPSSSLRHLEILSSNYVDGKIVILRFRIKSNN